MGQATELGRSGRLQILLRHVVMPVIRSPGPELALGVARALVDGGMTLVEVAWNCAQAPAVVAEIAGWPGVTVGAGTICDAATAEQALACGAQFLVSPILAPEVLHVAHGAEVPVALGAITPTEVHRARELGADLIKLFPVASLGGPPLLRDLREPFGDLPWLVSGGVTLDNAAEYRSMGARVLALGGALLPKAAVAAGDAETIRRNARAWRSWVASQA